MTSEERHAARYERRKRSREKKKKEKLYQYNNFSYVFNYNHMMNSGKQCLKGVLWKGTAQKFYLSMSKIVISLLNGVNDYTYKFKGFYRFDISERGKIRHIRSVDIKERCVQKTLCNYCMVPVIERRLIANNAASRLGKGYHYTIMKLREHLRHYIHVHGTEGYILLFDFKNYFESISHEECKNLIRRDITDPKLLYWIDSMIDNFNEDNPNPGYGLGLGSQISQILALLIADRIDHYITEVCGISADGRYMDDGYVIAQTKEELRSILQGIERLANEIGLHLNMQKTHIVKLTHGFTYCKKRFLITNTGKIIMKISHKSIAIERQKLKKLFIKLCNHEISLVDVYAGYQSWRAYAAHGNAYHTIHNMDLLYKSYFSKEGYYGKQTCLPF